MNVWRQPERATQSQVLLSQIEIIEPVKPDFMILGFDEDRLPSVPILLFRIDDCRLDDEEPRPESLPVPALQNAEFASLDVNFHEVNGPVLDIKIANLSEPDNLNLMRGCGESGSGETGGDGGGERRIFSQGRNLVKSREARAVTDGALQIYISRSGVA